MSWEIVAQLTIDVKLLTLKGKSGSQVKRFQYTAVDDGTRPHRSDQDEFYQLLSYKDDQDLHTKMAEWEQFYNFSRLRGAHPGKTPYEAMREKLL